MIQWARLLLLVGDLINLPIRLSKSWVKNSSPAVGAMCMYEEHNSPATYGLSLKIGATS